MHTKEPWSVDEIDYKSHQFYIRGSHDNGKPMTFGLGAVAHMPRSRLLPTKENARRIVACVNACAGIPTELVEQGGFAAIPVATHREVKQQRDELLAALKAMLGNTEADSDEACAAHRQARAAIAKAESN